MNQEDKEKVNQASKFLSEKLTESDEYQNLMQTREKVENDEKALQLIQDYQEKMQQRQQMGGLDLGDGESIKDIRARMEKNELVKEYIKAEEEWSQLLQDLFEQCSYELDFNFMSALGGCC